VFIAIKKRGNLMKEYSYVYGPVPSRRLGLSLGISPIPKKVCNYSCIYCQLGRTNKMSNIRKSFFDCDKILAELKDYIEKKLDFDVITIVGEGEPTLYSDLGKLIIGIKKLTDKIVVVITNGALLYDKNVCSDLMNADIVLPSIDAYDENSFKLINRPSKGLSFEQIYKGLINFSNEYKGKLWLEIMLVKGFNDGKEAINKLNQLIKNVKYDKLYINTPIRPPAESYALQIDKANMNYAVELLQGFSIDNLISSGFHSEIIDDYDAILSIIKRHPMNQFEIKAFLESRKCTHIEEIFNRLSQDNKVDSVKYKNYYTYRLK
jgi:wyosine [tRNA(Phe)-imidazoG37] synthetase (radical SAM superfamily)